MQLYSCSWLQVLYSIVKLNKCYPNYYIMMMLICFFNELWKKSEGELYTMLPGIHTHHNLKHKKMPINSLYWSSCQWKWHIILYKCNEAWLKNERSQRKINPNVGSHWKWSVFCFSAYKLEGSLVIVRELNHN